METSVPNLRASYDRVAADYASHFRDELENKPFDRKMLEWLTEKVANSGGGRICDMGCGPGQVAGYLRRLGADACGIDLSAAMVENAGRLYPDVSFQQGDMLALTGVPDGSYGGIAAFYSIVHIGREDVVRGLMEMRRVLRPGGVLLLAFHLGREVVHKDEWWGHEVSVDFFFYERQEMLGYFEAAGFALEEAIERDPYPELEFPSRRGYLFARRP